MIKRLVVTKRMILEEIWVGRFRRMGVLYGLNATFAGMLGNCEQSRTIYGECIKKGVSLDARKNS
jgi:hypothetical protein